MDRLQPETTETTPAIRKLRAVPSHVPVPKEQPLEPEEGCLHELFERHAELRPTATALVGEGFEFSYGLLDAKANQLARYLRFHGAGPGRFVALYFERSAHPILALLACLKAGAAYVPIDPLYPADRIRHILSETEPVILLTEQALEARAAEFFSGERLAVDVPDNAIDKQPAWRLRREETGVSPSDLCYVIYTSGTTGRPKGVMTEHGNAYRFVRAFNEICETTSADRIFQGFSLGFDGSVEEIWMAFSNGATLVVGDRSTPRFGDELARHLDRERITYFSTVPTLLSTLSEDVASLRCLVVSGEACPPELVDRWARPGRRMWNVYGPTEATVNTTAAECIAGRPITIGRPLRGYETFILDEEGRPVRPGERGELFVAGKTLARGYLKQPVLTAERFVPAVHLGAGRGARLYRTGDLVRLNDDGELEFFGRIDSQVKIRGYRVELAEIESILRENTLVRAACVQLVDRDGIQTLAAYIVPVDPSTVPDRNALLAQLEERLPDYMIPGFLDVIAELPMLTSGKVDRRQLPPPVMALVRSQGTIIEPATALEAEVTAVWAAVLGVAKVSVEDDFFLDLNGHSLLAAQMVTRLRGQGREVAIRDAYRFPTVRKLAAHLGAATEPAAARPAARSAREVFATVPRLVRWFTSGTQLLTIYGLYSLGTTPVGAVLLLLLRVYQGTTSRGTAVAVLLAITFGTWPVLLFTSIATKWVLIGRYRAGEYPVWGFYYLRWWLATRLQGLSGAGAFAGTPILPLYYRLMGAKVGRDCSLDTALCAAWDMVTIGDETSIGADTQLLGYRVENGMLKIGRVTLGNRVFVGIHSALGLNVTMGDDSRLDDQSLLPDGTELELGQQRRGSPAAPASVMVPEPIAGARRRPVLFGAIHLFLAYAMGIVFLLPTLPFLGLNALAWWHFGIPGLVVAVLVSVPLAVIFYCLFVAALKRLLLPRAKPGVYSLESAFYLRKWLADGIMVAARRTLLPVFTTIYLPPWLRLMGAKIGARAELSTVWYCSPEMLDIGEESFLADGCIIGGRRTFRGQFEIGVNRIGRRSFVGNSAILPMGASLGDRCLLGVVSMPPGGSKSCVADGTEWLGSPSFALPNRHKVGHFDDAVIFKPTKKLYAQRLVIDALRIVIPDYLGLAAAIAWLAGFYFSYRALGAVKAIALAPLIAMALALATTLSVVALKKSIMGTFEPVIKPLWSVYVWLNEMVNGIYESVMAPTLGPLQGTPFVTPFLRLLGCRIGKHAFIESVLFSEWDLIEIGDYAALNAGSIIQTHLFEDRVMKSSYLKIGNDCSVGNMAVVLYDTDVADGNTIGPLSLLMKGERLAAGGRWHGIPTVPLS